APVLRRIAQRNVEAELYLFVPELEHEPGERCDLPFADIPDRQWRIVSSVADGDRALGIESQRPDGELGLTRIKILEAYQMKFPVLTRSHAVDLQLKFA